MIHKVCGPLLLLIIYLGNKSGPTVIQKKNLIARGDFLYESLHYISQVTTSLKTLFLSYPVIQAYFLGIQKQLLRNRKIDFKTLVGITMNSGGATMSKELLDYFDFKVSTPTMYLLILSREESVNA